MKKMNVFTEEELRELAAFDAEVERTFRLSLEEIQFSKRLDNYAKFERMDHRTQQRIMSVRNQKERYRQTHRSEIKEAKKQYREEHSEEYNAYQTQYRKTHKEEFAAYNARYQQKHKAERAAYMRAWRKKRNLGGAVEGAG